ncbi:sulfotransferase family protein [Microcoleus sp. FACHB-672]|uniref:sulfotransferase family protein n=1 Tax=Microcoleus sp. FACHB-672 TaxID=2692825 RepID=UPI00168373F0|nr:sulfotransferase [Microcoleus sp. FACHB-672]MBD2041428.1 sulfotransferase [Microcoleus sp. FACHB-672]
MIRLFIVGCPRSGTTLLQCLLAAHSQMISFPESHLHYDFSKAGDQLNEFDQIAQQKQLAGWIEKTPRHLHFIEQIQALCPSAKFIHCLRDARANVASLYGIERHYGASWGYQPKTIRECFQRWQHDYQLSQAYSNQPNHKLVQYEDLSEKPSAILLNICQYLALEFEPNILVRYPEVLPSLAQQAPWKNSVKEPIKNFNMNALSYLFPEETNELEKLCLDANL